MSEVAAAVAAVAAIAAVAVVAVALSVAVVVQVGALFWRVKRSDAHGDSGSLALLSYLMKECIKLD